MKLMEKYVMAMMVGLSLSAGAQTIKLANGVQKFASLTGTTVNMSGQCELWVTNSTTPLAGCTINLNSIDAWLFLPNVKPSAVASSYLSQLRVSGANAVADSNVRVVQYGQNGAVVIPQSSTFQPLTVYNGPEFSGVATKYGQWTYYTGAGIANISSFKLKRGYMAVLAQSANGASYSKCYVAQDGDLEVGVLPATLDKQVQFIYVTPWRWVPKKGIAGDPGISQLNLGWWYNWNISSSSTRDLEYAAIRQLRYWPSLGQNWKSLGINSVLGYNEPDHVDQANMAVGDAIWSWPDLLATGLRVGSPACSDGGVYNWLFPFMSQVSTSQANEAGAAGMRVDFVAQHYYQAADPANPSACASQMYNFLLNIWNKTHKPIWITEWNNGANWTDNNPYPAPTYAQQQADIQAMVNMLESTPFVERYALYNWVEDTRAVTTNSVLTGAGVVYRDKVSNLSYSQAMPDNGTRGIAEYLFATNCYDSSGYYNNGMAIGAPSYTAGHNSQASAIALDGKNSYVQLPANIADGNAFTFAAWVYWNGGANWQRIFDFGSVSTLQGGTPNQYMFLTPSSGSGTLRFAITSSGAGSEQQINAPFALPSGSWQHVTVTLNGAIGIIYLNGTPVATNSISIVPSAFGPTKNYLGKSQFASDALFGGKLDDVEIADYAMTAGQISSLYSHGPSPDYVSGVWTNNINSTWSASGNWADGIIPNGVGRMADFSSIDITADRVVGLDSPRVVGGLRFGDVVGSQNWTLTGANTLTLEGGGANAPQISVNQNTATIFTPLAGTNGFAKEGNGTLKLINSANAVGGSLMVKAGTVNMINSTTTFGSGTSFIGYRTGGGNLTMTGGGLSTAGEVRVGGSDLSGTQYNATGAVSLANSTLSVGALIVARGNYLDNSVSGAVTLNAGATLISTNDVIVEYAGTGQGKVVINGGTFIAGPAATKWFMVGYYDSGAGEVDIYNGNLFLENGTSIKMCRGGNTGTNVFNQYDGNVTFYSDAGVTVGGGGNLDLNYAGKAASSSIYNLNGGTLTVPKIIASSGNGTGTFNFNGGTLQPAGDSSTFMQGLTTANVMPAGVKIDTAGHNITIGQALLAGNFGSGGLTKSGDGTLTLTAANTFIGNTTVTAGTLALGSGGSIADSANIALANGAVLDVSAVGGNFTLGVAQTLSGNGGVNGMIVNNGTIAPGNSGSTMGTLTLSNAPALNGVTRLKVNRNDGAPLNDQIQLPSAGVNYGGTLTVMNVGAPLQAGDTFHLFSAPSYGGNFATTNLPTLGSGLAWSNSLAINGSISVVSTVLQVPTNIVLSVSGTSLKLSWPADHIGWRLQMQTNGLASTNWVDVPGASLTNDVTLPVDATKGNVFYRLVYP